MHERVLHYDSHTVVTLSCVSPLTIGKFSALELTITELAVVVWVWTPTLCLGLFHRRFMQWHTIMFAWERWGNPCGLDQAEKGSGKKTVMVLTIPLMPAYLPQYIHLWPLSFRSTTNVWWQFLPSSWLYSGWPSPTELKHDGTELSYLLRMFCWYE